LARGRLGRRVFGDRSAQLRGLDRVLGRFDLVHSAETHLPISEQAAKCRRAGRGRLVITCWENIPFLYDDNPRIAARKELVRSTADLFVAVTGAARDALILEGVPRDRIAVQPVGVDRRVFRPLAREDGMTSAWRIPPGWRTVIYCGRLIREKGILDLVLALPLMDRTVLVLVGEGPERLRVEIAARSLGVSDRLRFVGGLPYHDMPRAYATADAFCLPSVSTPYWQEQFGMVLVEAMACGLPVVTTATGSIPEVVGEAAMVVPPNDPDALASSISTVLEDSARRDDLRAAALARVEERYDAKSVSRAIGDIYKAVLDS
jgi:glycosyltransferase involved in cell wall biosynthesis